MSHHEHEPVPAMTETGEERQQLIESLLDQESTWAEPGPGVAEGILATIATSGATVDEPRSPKRSLKWVAAVGVAAAALVVVWLWPDARADNPDDVVVAVVGTDLAPRAAGTVVFGPRESGWWIRLDVSRLPPAPEGTYYEGWVGDGSSQVSVGTFHMRNGSEPVVMWSGVSLDEYPELKVTLQPEDGGADPTDEVYLTGRLDWSP
jgi:hypothetical protein